MRIPRSIIKVRLEMPENIFQTELARFITDKNLYWLATSITQRNTYKNELATCINVDRTMKTEVATEKTPSKLS